MSKYKEFRLFPNSCQRRLFFKKDLNTFAQNLIQRVTAINVRVIKADRLKSKKYQEDALNMEKGLIPITQKTKNVHNA